jgi:hypothetical protein
VSLTPPLLPRRGRQLSLFGVEAADPAPADLAGLLAGPGQVVRMGGTARVSVVVDAAWRVHVLVTEFAARGLAATWVATADSHLGVRTAYARSLAPLGVAWLRGAVKRPPAGFHLDGPRLRLWVAAAGSPGPLGFQLRLGSDEECWDPVGAALAAVGLPAVLVTPRAAKADPVVPPPSATEGDLAAEAPESETAPSPILGAAYRITGRRRLARLAELVGERPPAAPVDAWPGH